MTLNYFQMFHDATREHAESLGARRLPSFAILHRGCTHFHGDGLTLDRAFANGKCAICQGPFGFNVPITIEPDEGALFHHLSCEIERDIRAARIAADHRPMRQAIKADEARHMRAPMYDGEPLEWVRVECECGETMDAERYWLTGNNPECDWRIERCDGSSCGIENCGRMLAKCGRCE